MIERGREVMDSKDKAFRPRTEEEGEGDDIEIELDFIDDDEGQLFLPYIIHTNIDFNCASLSTFQ